MQGSNKEEKKRKREEHEREQHEAKKQRSWSTITPSLPNISLKPNRTLKSAIGEAFDIELGRRKRAREGAEGEGDGGESARPASRPRRRGR